MDHIVLIQHHAEKIFEYYNSPSVAAGYGRKEYITPCEELLFSTYIKPGMAILDIGVGGGRTSPYLAKDASRYVGIDYAPEMVRLCRRKYPQWEYCEGSAFDLSLFQEGSFDAVVMSYNVLDDLIPDESRWHCLRECRRVLGSNGFLIFSSHNPRAIIVRPELTNTRHPCVAQFSNSVINLLWIITDYIVALGTLAYASLRRACNYGRQPAFWRGEGYMLDNQKLMTHFWVPKNAIAELSRHGFQVVALQGDDYPKESYQLSTDWYYYVFQKVA